jgi:hypothetical protein
MHIPGRWVGSDGPVLWPPRLPDIVLLDLCLWGYVKDIVYKTPVISFDELKLKIVTAIEKFTPQILENACGKIEYRLDIIRVMNVAHVKVVSYSAVINCLSYIFMFY